MAHLFKRFEALWGEKWRRANENPDAWAMALADQYFGAVSWAAEQAPRAHPAWPPCLAEFLALVRSYRLPLSDRQAKRLPRARANRNVVDRELARMRELVGKRNGPAPERQPTRETPPQGDANDTTTTGGEK